MPVLKKLVPSGIPSGELFGVTIIIKQSRAARIRLIPCEIDANGAIIPSSQDLALAIVKWLKVLSIEVAVMNDRAG